MNEETIFNCTDELMMQAREDHTDLVSRLEESDYDSADLASEIRQALSAKRIDWSKVYILAVMGAKLDGIN